MLSHVFLAGDMDPTISVGGILKAIGGNIRVGNSGLFITEACEYTNSFLHFLPKISVILNVEEDHMDFFKDIDDICNSFHRFAALLPKDGTLVINHEIEHLDKIIRGLDCRVITYSTKASDTGADYRADHISYDLHGNVSFDVITKDGQTRNIRLSVNGLHNVSNALSTIAVADLLEIPTDTLQKGLYSFNGTDRRFQYKGEYHGFTIIDDYAHHPTEIAATLDASTHYPHKELWCVFQPHTYTRTKAFFNEFAEVLSRADHVILADIYAARETETLGMSSSLLADSIREKGGDAYYFPTFEEIRSFLLENCSEGDLLITMGAGDVVNIAESILEG